MNKKVLSSLVMIADVLDDMGFYKEAKVLDRIIVGQVETYYSKQIKKYKEYVIWGISKGESDENLLDALKRELQEELQLTKIKKIIPLHSYQSRSKDFIYETYIALVSKEFIPELNEENIGYAWTNIDCLPNPIHPKTKQMLNSKRLKEKLKNFYNWMDKKNGKNNTIS